MENWKALDIEAHFGFSTLTLAPRLDVTLDITGLEIRSVAVHETPRHFLLPEIEPNENDVTLDAFSRAPFGHLEEGLEILPGDGAIQGLPGTPVYRGLDDDARVFVSHLVRPQDNQFGQRRRLLSRDDYLHFGSYQVLVQDRRHERGQQIVRRQRSSPGEQVRDAPD